MTHLGVLPSRKSSKGDDRREEKIRGCEEKLNEVGLMLLERGAERSSMASKQRRDARLHGCS